MNPLDVINYNRTVKELQLFLLFAMAVAGKNAERQGKKLERLMSLIQNRFHNPEELNPFQMILSIGEVELEALMRQVKLGKYNLLVRGFMEASMNFYGASMLRDASVEELTTLYGVGFKTAKFFVMFSRDTETHAVLDTHILKWIRREHPYAPSVTPTSITKYEDWEFIFMKMIANAKGYTYTTSITSRELVEADFAIWKHYSQGEPLPDYLK